MKASTSTQYASPAASADEADQWSDPVTSYPDYDMLPAALTHS